MFKTRTKVEFVEMEEKKDSFIEDMLKWVRWGKSIKSPRVEEEPSDDPFINDMRAWTRWGRQR